MVRKVFILFLTLMISLSLCACTRDFRDRDMDIYEKIHKRYNSLTSYSADVSISVFSNKTENQYFLSQKFCAPDKFFTRATDKAATFSVVTITNGTKTKTYADGSEYSLVVPSNDFLSLLYVNNFFSAYYLSEETALSVNASLSESDQTILSLELSDNDSVVHSASLSVDNKTLIPHTLTLYNADGEKLLIATYQNFKFNDKIDLSVFDTD